MSLLATYPDFTLPLGRAQPAYYLSPLPSLVPFTSPSLLSFPLTQLSASQPEAGPACHEPPMMAHERQGKLQIGWLQVGL
jgi:hypothetical protein